MKPIFDHRANHDLKINYNTIKGDFIFEDFVKNLDEVVHNPEYIDSYNILVDIREVNFVDFMKNLSILIDYIQDKLSFFNMNRKCSFITIKPLDVVYATLMIKRLQSIGIKMKFQVFYSEAAALSWMSI